MPVGSEQTEMRMRQMCGESETQESVPSQQGMGGRAPMPAAFAGVAAAAVLASLSETKKTRDPNELPPNSEQTFQHVKKDRIIAHPGPTPTLEEVCAWAQSFDNLMVTPAGRNAFREFLRTEFSEENMLFWMACEELKKEANKSTIEEKARIIYENYISILSPKEVSLDSRVREVINRNMVDPSQHIFDDAQLQIYTLMHRDSYPRFMNSTVYKDLLKSLAEKAVEA
ncbi:Regulator of G-protein signaling 20 [Apodemus speciosus]|uniref:Regulator of G-protein signaling 20 n=1 Tax=Apodemus speciosus TaxID=105296 RepID=A0ABQ0ECH0_APOSI